MRPFASNDGFEVASRPNVLLVELDMLLVIELKLGEAGDTEFAQLTRYLRNEEIASTFLIRRHHGVLVADRFQAHIVEQANRRADVTLVRYGQGPDGRLQLGLVVAPDVLPGIACREVRTAISIQAPAGDARVLASARSAAQ